jgi:hypothetical protein
MLPAATSENVASPYCSDEHDLNPQKMADGGDTLGKF